MKLLFPHHGSHRCLSFFLHLQVQRCWRDAHLPSSSFPPLHRPLWVLLWWREQFMHLLIYLFACQCGLFLSGPRLATLKHTRARPSQPKAEARRCVVGWLFTKRVKESCVSSLLTFRFVCSVKRIKPVWDRTLPRECQPGTMGVLESKVTIQSV